MARFFADLALGNTFPWLRWTIFQEVFVNHHLGFQLLLFPFVFLSDLATGNLMWGGQAAVLVYAGLTAMCLHRVLVLLRVPYPLLWLLLMGLFPWQYWMRQTFVRAPVVALPMMLFAVELIIRRRPVLLGMWAFAFMLVYFGAVLFAMITVCILAGMVFVEGFRRIHGQILLGALAGLALGFLVHPSFPENIAFMKIQLFDSGFSARGDIGSEWKPPPFKSAIIMWWPLLALWGGSLAWRLKGGIPVQGSVLGLLLLSVGMLFLYLLMRRFVEYAPVFLLISAAALVREQLAAVRWSLRPSLTMPALLVLVAIAMSGPLIARGRVKPSFHAPRIQPAMTWLAENTPPGSLVLTDDWDIFPRCFYFNRHNRYAVGLDPMFTARPYPEHWRRYRLITRGKASSRAGDPGDASLEDIGRLFLADYVLVMDDHPTLYRQLLRNPGQFELVFPEGASTNQPPAAIFQVSATPPGS